MRNFDKKLHQALTILEAGQCPECGAEAYVGFNTIECPTKDCRHFSEKEALNQGVNTQKVDKYSYEYWDSMQFELISFWEHIDSSHETFRRLGHDSVEQQAHIKLMAPSGEEHLFYIQDIDRETEVHLDNLDFMDEGTDLSVIWPLVLKIYDHFDMGTPTFPDNQGNAQESSSPLAEPIPSTIIYSGRIDDLR